jgi:hypothetical protein
MLFLDGVYAIEGERLCFRRVSAPIYATLEVLVQRISERERRARFGPSPLTDSAVSGGSPA